jgi:hypothetical protein
MYGFALKILEENLTHFKKNLTIEIEGYNKRGDKMGALGCAMAYEQIFADISDAIETLKSISDEMSEVDDEELRIMSKDVKEGEEIDRRDGTSGDDIYKKGEAEDG